MSAAQTRRPPGLSADPARLARTAAKDLARDGYCVLDRVLGPERLADLRTQVDRCAQAEAEDGTAWLEEPDNQRVWMLLNKGAVFADLVLDGADLVARTGLLGGSFLLSNVTANIVRPGGRLQAAHADQDFVGEPWQRAEVVTLLWMLDEFTAANGATRLLPGSHADPARHDDEDLSAAAAACAPAGSLLLLDGRLWHAAGANATADGTRRAVIVNYCRPYLRQQENFWRSAEPELLRAATPDLLDLLGANVHDSLGMVNGLTPAWRRRAAGEFGPSWR